MRHRRGGRGDARAGAGLAGLCAGGLHGAWAADRLGAGTGRVLEALDNFRFDDETVSFLREHDVVNDELAAWLADYRFSGDIWGYPDGELYFPGSPIMVVEGSFAEACILETLLLSIYNYDSAVASAASRMTAMAGHRPCIEMGSRRTNEWAAVAAARAAYIAGFASSSARYDSRNSANRSA